MERFCSVLGEAQRNHSIIRQMFAPITHALVEDAQIGSQHTVLEIATVPESPH
jgi:hypothetical protein